MLLYHNTNKDIDILKPKYFGYNHYTKNDKECCSIPRLFFYDSRNPKEYHLEGCSFCYVVDIPKKEIYDLDKDKEKLKGKFDYDIDKILKYIKQNYTGCCYTTSFVCYCVFKDIKPIKKGIN